MGKRAFRVGDRVVIDNDASIVAIVVAVMLEYKAKSYKCAWFHEGTHHTEWFYPDRLTLHV
jgi:uncharacterized protein YodC (DUF2158 family)